MKALLNSRRGSALLVVLGMLAFMLFSGLAFSVYMRQSRLPTSFLRRTATTRQLTKAALAEAINQIDMGIGNDPHPGVHIGTYQSGVVSNIWSHRVFIGSGRTSSKNGSTEKASAGNVYPAYADPNETVPTLTLEGIAYLPPNLINEARYYSQRTPTAQWHSFWFDSGRYAYTAIDVSDYFDVNRVFANKQRGSSAARRISFAHLFESGEGDELHSSPGTSDAKSWDSFMNKFRTDTDDEITYKQYPFVSLADFNLAWGGQTIGGFKCPFNGFVKSGQAYDCGDDANDPAAEKYRLMTFVTDGWFPTPKSNGSNIKVDLENTDYQPFRYDDLKKERSHRSIDDISTYAYAGPLMQKWAVTSESGSRLNQMNYAALWDYLDADSVPVSLCVPTVERTPMICGIRPSFTSDIQFPVISSPANGDSSKDVPDPSKQGVLEGGDKWDYYTREVAYTLDASQLKNAIQDVRVMLMYPFMDRGAVGTGENRWNLDGKVTFFMAAADKTIGIRTDNSVFASVTDKANFDKTAVNEQALITFPLKGRGAINVGNFPSGKNTDPVYLDQLTPSGEPPADADLVLVNVTYSWKCYKYIKDDDGNPTDQREANPTNPDPIPGSDFTSVTLIKDGTFYPLASDGRRATGSVWEGIKNKLQSGEPSTFKVYANLWVRLADTDGETVDLVPACHLDDENLNGGIPTGKCAGQCGGGYDGYPLMRVLGGQELSWQLSTMGAGQQTLGKVSFPDCKWIVADPRYNYAPENWVLSTGGGVLDVNDWSGNTEIKNMISSRDGDFYMQTSDVGYMQSIYELAFLPRISEGFTDALKGDVFHGNYSTAFDRTDYPTSFTSGNSGPKDYDFMWKTYSPWMRYNKDEFADLRTMVESKVNVCVNPYSDSPKVLMAAFANSPHDWRCAATDEDSPYFDMEASAFNAKYAWNAYSSETTGKICWDCLEDVADAFQQDVRESGDWETAFRDLGWSSNKRKILNDLDDVDDDDADIYCVDKKFLYGFWHDSFAARQQLFLIFLRAEPMMMGGGVSGQIPPQLGARAVALVWRDPTKTTGTRTGDTGISVPNPHRTRVLFYHQFD